MRKYFIILALAITGFLLYLPSLKAPFLWDDEDFVYANKYVENFQIDKFFTESQTAGRGKLSNYFRPIPQIIYATTHSLFDLPAGRQGFNPFWFHLVNVLTHIAATMTVFIFFINFLRARAELPFSARSRTPTPALAASTAKWHEASALFIALFFLVHPVQNEAVSYISGLSDPLFVLFGFLSLIYFPQKKSLLFFVLSLLSKETGLVFLGLIFLLNYKKGLSYLIATSLYLLYHFKFINSLDMASVWGNSPYAQSVFVRLLTFTQNLWTYFGLLLYPKDLFMERDYSISIVTEPNFNILAILVILTAIFYLIRKNKLLVFCFLAFFISFLPYSGLVLINGIFYEHFLYLPLVFFFAFFIILFNKYQKILLIFCILYLGILSVRTIVRELDWIDPIRFYSQTLEHAPQSIRIINGLAMAYAEAGMSDEAIEQYNSGIKLNPRVPNLYHNLANVYAAQGNLDLAEENYLKAIEIDPTFTFSWQSLANLYQQTGQKEKLTNLVNKYQILNKK